MPEIDYDDEMWKEPLFPEATKRLREIMESTRKELAAKPLPVTGGFRSGVCPHCGKPI